MPKTVLNAAEQVAGAFKAVELDVGSEYVGDATFTITDALVKPTSIVVAQVLGLSPSNGRSTQEAYLEQVNVFATPGNGTIRFDLQPKRGEFMGKFVVGYQLS